MSITHELNTWHSVREN